MIGVDPRVSGTQRYSVHVERPGMLHAAFVRSPHAHARVLAVDASGLPGDCVALLPEDVADLGRYGCQARDQRVLADVARHAGDIVAAVAAPTAAAARAAARRVDVTYEELPAVFDAVEAVAPGAPLLHPDAAESAGEAVSIGVRPLTGTNVCHRFRIRHGDAAAGFADADVIVSRAFRTPGAAHAPMEPHAALAEWEDGRLTLWTGTQTPFNTRADVAGAFGLRPDDVRVVAPPMGGSFGAKTFVRLEALVRRARAQGRPPREGDARPRGGVPLPQPPPGDDPRPRRGEARRHARREGARLLGRHRRLRRLRARRGDEDGLRGRRPVPDPARPRRRARDLHQPAAERRLPRLRGDAVRLGLGADDGRAGGGAGHQPARAAPAQPAARRRRVRHRRGHARRPLRGVPRRGGARGRLRGGPARRRPVRPAEGDADPEPGGGPRRAQPGRLRRAQRVVRDGPGRARLDPADGGRAARLRAGPGRGAGPRHRHEPVRHPHHLEPLDAHDGPRARRRRPRPAGQRRRARLRRGRQRGRAGPRHGPGDRLHPLAPGRRRPRA